MRLDIRFSRLTCFPISRELHYKATAVLAGGSVYRRSEHAAPKRAEDVTGADIEPAVCSSCWSWACPVP